MVSDDINDAFIHQAFPARLLLAAGRSATLETMTSPKDSLSEIHQRLLDLYEAYAESIGQKDSLTQAEFARRIGITAQTWRQITAVNRVSVDTALKISRATGVDLDWIYTGDPAMLPQRLGEILSRIANTRRSISPAKRA
jgi:DNA-binding XRE family transcriptional regulator